MIQNLIKNNIDKLFPISIMILQMGAAIIYCYGGDVRKSVYWISATILTASVTF